MFKKNSLKCKVAIFRDMVKVQKKYSRNYQIGSTVCSVCIKHSRAELFDAFLNTKALRIYCVSRK